MKKKYVSQLFEGAEGGQASTGTGTQQGQGTPDQNTKDTSKDSSKGDDPDKGKGSEGEKKYTDADVDRILSEKFAKWSAKKDKEVDEAKKLESMNAQQKAEYQRDQYEKELNALKKANLMAEMERTARKMLSDDGINCPDELVDMIITDDAEKTKSNVTSFTSLFKSAVQTAVKDALKHKTTGGSSSGNGVTKESIMAITNRAERQKMIAEHLDLFK